jgi:hypothetical protein
MIFGRDKGRFFGHGADTKLQPERLQTAACIRTSDPSRTQTRPAAFSALRALSSVNQSRRRSVPLENHQVVGLEGAAERDQRHQPPDRPRRRQPLQPRDDVPSRKTQTRPAAFSALRALSSVNQSRRRSVPLETSHRRTGSSRLDPSVSSEIVICPSPLRSEHQRSRPLTKAGTQTPAYPRGRGAAKDLAVAQTASRRRAYDSFPITWAVTA